MGYVAFFIILGTIIFVHEFGHLLAAKAVGIRVEVFSIGFLGKICGFIWKGTEYRLGWFPLGGYIKPDEERFRKSSVLRRLPVIIAGVTANFIFGFLLLFGVFFSHLSTNIPLGENVTFFDRVSIAAKYSAVFGSDIMVKNAEGLVKDVPKDPVKSLAGPVGIAIMTKDAYVRGAENLIIFTAVLSLVVGFMNILPIPLLDGGALVLLLLEALRGKPLAAKTESVLQNFGLVLLATIIGVALYADIFRILS